MPTPAEIQNRLSEDVAMPLDTRVRLGSGASIDYMLDRAVAAINRHDRAVASALAGQMLAADISVTLEVQR